MFHTKAEWLHPHRTDDRGGDSRIERYNREGYLERSPIDPWGNRYVYISPGLHNKDYDLESYGKDGEEGGTDEDADIESWNIENS